MVVPYPHGQQVHNERALEGLVAAIDPPTREQDPPGLERGLQRCKASAVRSSCATGCYYLPTRAH